MAGLKLRPNYPVLASALAFIFWALPASAADDTDKVRRRILELNHVTGEDPIEGQIKILVADAAATKQLLAAAIPLAQHKDQALNYNAAYILARSALEMKDVEAGQVFYRLCADKAQKLKSVRKMAQAYGGLLGLLLEHKKYAESEKLCKEILEMGEKDRQLRPLRSGVLRLLIQVLAKEGKLDEALNLANSQVEAHPDDWRALELKGIVLREAGQYDEAAKTYEEILEKVDADKSLQKKEKEARLDVYRYILSGVYVDMNEIDKAADQLKALLDKDPKNPTYNNDLGYIWADHDRNLQEAEKMIRRALEEDRKLRQKDRDLKPEEDKDNAAYLDSLGWVLYKQKKYQEAKKYLLQAVQDPQEGQHTEIYDHLGDVHMVLGEKAEAMAAWKKAIEVARPGKREQERKAQVEKKLKKYQPSEARKP